MRRDRLEALIDNAHRPAPRGRRLCGVQMTLEGQCYKSSIIGQMLGTSCMAPIRIPDASYSYPIDHILLLF